MIPDSGQFADIKFEKAAYTIVSEFATIYFQT